MGHIRKVFGVVDWEIQLLRRRGGEAGIAVPGPLHGRADAIPIAEVDVVPHAELVAVVENRTPGQGEEQGGEQLDLAPIIVEQRGQAPPDPDVLPVMVAADPDAASIPVSLSWMVLPVTVGSAPMPLMSLPTVRPLISLSSMTGVRSCRPSPVTRSAVGSQP